MPRGDRTGPAGAGPRTGRAAGYCAGFSTPGYANPRPRLGLGCGFGFGYGFGGGGRGWRHWFRATGLPGWMRFRSYARTNPKSAPESEKQALQDYTQELQSELDAVKVRLAELESESNRK